MGLETWNLIWVIEERNQQMRFGFRVGVDERKQRMIVGLGYLGMSEGDGGKCKNFSHGFWKYRLSFTLSQMIIEENTLNKGLTQPDLT